MLKQLFNKKKVSKEQWNEQYLKDDWQFLWSLDELGRYSIIEGYIRHFDKGKKILDIGCGEGVLQKNMKNINYEEYVGIDLSSTAIGKAKQNENAHTKFMIQDIREFNTPIKFDVIVFNEVLYYFSAQALDEVKRSAQFLEPDGLAIVSMTDFRSSQRIFKQLEKAFLCLDKIKIANKKGNSWICACYRINKNCASSEKK